MAPRKSRTRRTADVMAKYKEQADTQIVVRKSPRGKKHTPSSGSESSPKSRKSFDARDDRPSEKRIISNSRNSSRSVKERCALNEDNTPNVGRKRSNLRLEEMTEIPETPPRQEQVPGRKRVWPSRPLDLCRAQQVESSEDGDDESQRPSKKRKSFNTPPRDNQNGRQSVEFKSGVFGASLVTDEGHARLSQAECGSNNGSIGFADEDIEDELITPVVPSSRKQYSSSAVAARRVNNSSAFPRMEAPQPWGSKSADLDVIETSSVTISRVIESLNKSLVAEIRDMLMSHKGEVQAMKNRMTATISSDIHDMRSTIDMVMNRMKGNTGARSGPKTSLSAWEEKLNAMTPHADILFNTNVFARILCINAPLKVVEVFQKFDGVDGRKSVVAMQALLFSLQPGEKKDLYSVGIGLQHSEFLYATVQNALFNVCSDKLELFRQNTYSSRQEKEALDPGIVTPKTRLVETGLHHIKSY